MSCKDRHNPMEGEGWLNPPLVTTFQGVQIFLGVDGLQISCKDRLYVMAMPEG